MTVNLKLEVCPDAMKDVLCRALMGGVDHWCDSVTADSAVTDLIEHIVDDNGKLIFRDKWNGKYYLSRARLLEAIGTYVTDNFIRNPYLCDEGVDCLMFIGGEVDSIAADIIVQYALWGERCYERH